ncbi:hypothetical protein GJAV_G00109570 [Gymnothorax javanicus]|nr:hypothetical protein GJAV_G00109570 [Gymnothorax javanicus]
MAAFGGVGAFDLPCEIVIHIFSFLSDRDKIRASAVCSRWRECFFSPQLWTDQKLQVRGEVYRGATCAQQTPKLEFLMSKFGSFVRELHLDFSPSAERPMELTDDKFELEMFGSCGLMQSFADPWEVAMHCYLDQVLCVLRSLLNNRTPRTRRMVREVTNSPRITVMELQAFVTSWGHQVSKGPFGATSATTDSLEGCPEESLFCPEDTEANAWSSPKVT